MPAGVGQAVDQAPGAMKKPIVPGEDVDAPVGASFNASATFGRNFREARRKAGLSQKDIERLTGTSQHYISTIERGLENPTLDVVTRLAEAVGKTLAELLRP